MKKQFLHGLITVLLCLVAAVSQAQTIFDYGSSWKYLDNGSNQGTAWATVGFNDASWAVDTGFFGYGDTWITKCINACGTVSCSPSCGTKYITTYFRKVINLPSIAVYDSMIMNIKRDDAVAVYVNGVEVWRDPNMPTGTLTYTSAALTALGGVDEYTPITKTIPISYFVAGNNTIAVEVHQQSGTSSDLGFNMQMVGVPSLTLFDYGSTWKYLDNGSNQGAAWTATGFADGTWASDTGFFGYGDTWITKCVNACGTVNCTPSCGTKYITTYFRKVVSIPNPSLYDSIRFNIKRDDGVVVYVNGTEVMRDPNMPTGTITYTTAALTALGGVDEYTPITKSIPISAFTTGNNTIAVELHQQSGTSSDLGFNMQIVAVRHVTVTPVTLSQGPYLQKGNQTGVNVRWRTNVACRSRVLAGTVLGTYPLVANDTNRVTEHELRISGLTPDTKYYYQFGTDTSVIQGDSTNFFTTAPPDTSTRRVTIAAFGDCGRNDNSFQTGSLSSYQSYLAAQNMKAADLMLLVGDNAYDAGTDLEFSTNFFARYSGNILKNHMLFPCPGNHDYANTVARQVDHNVPYYSLFSLPSAGECGGVASGTEAYYSYNWGNVHVLSLDSYGEEDAGTTRLYDTTGAQVTWIKNDLAANTKKWTIAYWHHPPYTMGSHTSDGEAELVNIRQNFIRILERYGVDVIICGHSHDYERSYLLKGHYGTEASFNKAAHTTDSSSAKYNGTINSCPYIIPSGKVNHGTVYVVSGSAGADGGVQAGYPHNALPFAVDDGGMFYLDIQNNRLDAKFIRRNNTIGDQFTIMKDAKVRDTIAAMPGTPINLTATWQGAYAWNTGATSRSITFTTPNTDSLVTVKDSVTNTCIIDQHYIDALCTMPVFTVCPTNILTTGCNPTLTYVASATGIPAPAITYAFSGATTGAGTGTGSGTTFNAGITNVTITATNTCGSVNCTFTITVNAVPAAVTVTGGGMICGNTTLAASNGGSGTIYYQGPIPGGTSVATPSTSQSISTTGTYYFRARATDGCWGPEGSATVIVNPLPAAVAVTGAGTFCNNATITASNGGSGTIYYQGTTSGGTSVTTPSLSQVVASSGIYYFRAQSSAGCWGTEGSVAVTVNPLPATVTVTGGGTYCNSTTINASNGGSGTIYYQGTTSGGTSMATPASSQAINTSGTYYFRARSAAGCWGTEGSVTVTINVLPATVTASGAGTYCGSTMITAANGGSGTIYFQGTTSGGTSTSTASASQVVTASGTYYFRALSSAGCWGTEGSVTVIINPIPATVTVTGAGTYCNNATIAASNGGSGTIYFEGTTSGGISTAVPSMSQVVSTSGTYYFRARSSAGCWSTEGSAAVTVNALPATVTASGAGTFCGNTTITAANGGSGTIYYQGLTSGGTSTATPATSVIVTTTGTHYFRAQSSAGCWSAEGSVAVTVNPLPANHAITGGGSYCAAGTGVAVGLAGSDAGISYQLYNGATMVGAAMPGTGTALNWGLQTAAGSYTVMSKDVTSLCTSLMPGVDTITINPLPATYTVTGGGNYCAGGIGVHVGLGNSENGVDYQLYNGTMPVAAPFTGSGSSLDMGLQTAAGAYSIVAINATTACQNNMTGSAAVMINPLPSVYTMTGGGSYCLGGTGMHIGLAGSNTGIRYQLYNGTSTVGSSLPGVGGTLDFGLMTTTGSYTVIATDTATSCASNMAGTSGVSINALPAVYNVTGGGHYCTGGTGVHVHLSNSDAGITYQLYNGTSTSGSALAGTGSAIDFGLRTASGSYTVVATNTTTSCVNNMSSSAAVIPDPLPAPYALTGGGSYCAGGTGVHIGLGGSGNGIRYQLYKGTALSGTALYGTGSALDFGLRTPAGSYTVLATDTATACAQSMTGSSAVTITPLVMPSVSISSDKGSNICHGDLVTYTAMPVNGGSSPAYEWIVNAVPTGVVIETYHAMPNSGDVIAVNMTSNAPCAANTAGAAVAMKVDTVIAPTVKLYTNPGTSIAAGQHVTMWAMTTGTGAYTNYQWHKNGVMIPGATSSAYADNNLSDMDTVSCTVTTGNACGDHVITRGARVHVHSVYVPSVSAGSDITIIPNPNKGEFIIRGTMGTASADVSLEITNMLGQTIHTQTVTANNGSIDAQVQLKSVAAGVYTLMLRSGTDHMVFHLVIE